MILNMHIDLLESNVKVQPLFIRRPDKIFTTLKEKKKNLNNPERTFNWRNILKKSKKKKSKKKWLFGVVKRQTSRGISFLLII